jgi:hypothetical protein
MFGQAFDNLPRLFAGTFRKGLRKPLFKVARIVPLRARAKKKMEPSTSVCTNLPGRLRKPSASRCASLLPRVPLRRRALSKYYQRFQNIL